MKETDIGVIEAQLNQYEALFMQQTGQTLAEIAKIAVGLTGCYTNGKAAVIPVTSGFGVISGFAQAVAAILRHCGVETVVTGKTDVAGIQEAYLNRCDVAFLADDHVCAALGIGSAIQSDNGWATGQGFAAALVQVMKKRGITIENTRVLIIGAGPVGHSAARYLAGQRAIPVICDLDERKAAEAAKNIENAVVLPAITSVQLYPYIIEASTAADFITKADVTENTIISAPGMPCGITEAARETATVIHNPLELGIMTMYFDFIKKLKSWNQR
ncbi:MAG: 3-methylornithyl-N6-L-lysine dehydrogenase PylD [Clostridiaceae bacterium]|nr:3-methylornithyl-N6-L-lysine dehydrogenase PylD [Clostridiaceae bacterium]